jgi:hypothetical protein
LSELHGSDRFDDQPAGIGAPYALCSTSIVFRGVPVGNIHQQQPRIDHEKRMVLGRGDSGGSASLRQGEQKAKKTSTVCRFGRPSIDNVLNEGGSTMSEFVLLYRSTNETAGEAKGTAEKASDTMAKWQAWFKDMTEKGQLKNVGQPLDRSSGKVVGGKKKMVTDGPYAEAKEVIGGYSLIEAHDLDEAARIASGCPILEVGGSVEVRPVLILTA